MVSGLKVSQQQLGEFNQSESLSITSGEFKNPNLYLWRDQTVFIRVKGAGQHFRACFSSDWWGSVPRRFLLCWIMKLYLLDVIRQKHSCSVSPRKPRQHEACCSLQQIPLSSAESEPTWSGVSRSVYLQLRLYYDIFTSESDKHQLLLSVDFYNQYSFYFQYKIVM